MCFKTSGTGQELPGVAVEETPAPPRSGPAAAVTDPPGPNGGAQAEPSRGRQREEEGVWRGGGGTRGGWGGSPEAALAGRRAEALRDEAAASRPSRARLGSAQPSPAQPSLWRLRVGPGRAGPGRAGPAAEGDTEVLTVFPWHLTPLRRRMCPRAEAVRSMMGKTNPGVHPILYLPQYRKRPHTHLGLQLLLTILSLLFRVNDELSETGLRNAEGGKNRVGRQELFQSRILLLSVTPKHEDFINFIRSCHR
ncbi:uncharacterized protein VSU04_009794 [Chlamydotis macqueenii]